jgi:ferrous iron transport protein B
MNISTKARTRFSLDYGPEVEAEIRALQDAITERSPTTGPIDSRWLAIKLLEAEPGLADRFVEHAGGLRLLQDASGAAARLEKTLGIDVRLAIADRRYAFVGKVVGEALMVPVDEPSRPAPGERLDNLLTHPVLGVIAFLVVMYFVFSLVVEVSAPFLDWIDAAFAGSITRWTAGLLELMHAPAWLHGMLIEGVIAGVGGVLVFIPGLIVLFAFMAFLEDSGYLARAAFVMNRSLSWMGLNGKSFVPLILGFGCAVPAVYATRTLDRRRDRILTALLIPLMSCSARLPVYVVFSLAFFKQRANIVIWGLYALGVAVAALAGWVFAHTLLRSEDRSRFLLELPPYRWPSWRNVSMMVRQRTGAFLRNAGTVILAASLAIWLLLNLPGAAAGLESTYFGAISKRLAPIFEPAGFGTWEATGSLVSGLVAKEVVVATMAQIYVGEDMPSGVPASVDVMADLGSIVKGLLAAASDAGARLASTFTFGIVQLGAGDDPAQTGTALSRALETRFTQAAALAFLVYVLLYVPCVATLGALRAEFGLRWAAFAALYQSLLAWVGAVAVYQVTRFVL